jgi:formiminoglutamase
MHDFALLFDEIEESLYADIHDHNSWAESIILHREKLPTWKRKHLAIVGVPEERGTDQNLGLKQGADEIRKKLYRLKKGTGAYSIVDLGNLRLGETLQDTYERLSYVCETLLQHKVVPIIIGASHDLDIAQYNAYESFKELVSVVNVDAIIDMDDMDESLPTHHHLQKILSRKPNYLFSFSQLAYQVYLNSPKTLEVLEQLYFEVYSVGQIRPDLQEIEPVIRAANMLSFDITAIKMHDAIGNAYAQPFGLSAEEACQICWFAGINEKLSSLGIYEYNPQWDTRAQTASVIATMIWYFVEGYYHRLKHPSFESSSFNKYVVSALDNSGNMIFYKHKVSQKWWMEVPYPASEMGKEEKIIIPCSYKDYQSASEGEVPNRWINTYSKLV